MSVCLPWIEPSRIDCHRMSYDDSQEDFLKKSLRRPQSHVVQLFYKHTVIVAVLIFALFSFPYNDQTH